MNNGGNCRTCEFWTPRSQHYRNDQGQSEYVSAPCRRHAPMRDMVVTLGNSSSSVSDEPKWPVTTGAHGCGDWSCIAVE